MHMTTPVDAPEKSTLTDQIALHEARRANPGRFMAGYDAMTPAERSALDAKRQGDITALQQALTRDSHAR